MTSSFTFNDTRLIELKVLAAESGRWRKSNLDRIWDSERRALENRNNLSPAAHQKRQFASGDQ